MLVDETTFVVVVRVVDTIVLIDVIVVVVLVTMTALVVVTVLTGRGRVTAGSVLVILVVARTVFVGMPPAMMVFVTVTAARLMVLVVFKGATACAVTVRKHARSHISI